MATSDYIISQAEINAVHVAAQPDKLRGTAAQNKHVFDAYCDLIAQKHNAFVNYNAGTEDIDPAVLALAAEMGWVPDN